MGDRTLGLPTIRQKARHGGAGSVSGGADSDDAAESQSGEGTVLPPIGGIKAKRSSKKPMPGLKNIGSSTLQKPSIPMASMTVHGALAGSQASHTMGSSKSMGSTDMVMSDKMNSTWAGSRRYVSPFAAIAAPEEKKR